MIRKTIPLKYILLKVWLMSYLTSLRGRLNNVFDFTFRALLYLPSLYTVKSEYYTLY